MNQFLSLISVSMYLLYSTSLSPNYFCASDTSPFSEFNCYCHLWLCWKCCYNARSSIQLATDYSLFRLVTLCLINTGSSQLSLISDNLLSIDFINDSPILFLINFINEVQFRSWSTLSMQVYFNTCTTAFHTVYNLRQF